MKKSVIAIIVLIILAATGIVFTAANNSKEALSDDHIKALDPDFIKTVEMLPFEKQSEYLVIYESSLGVGTTYFERTPILKNWRAREHKVLPLERGISQDYLSFKINSNQKEAALVYGVFTPAEDYNLPIRLRNLKEQYDENPQYVETAQKDILWYQYLEQPAANPDSFELYNEITGTVITRAGE